MPHLITSASQLACIREVCRATEGPRPLAQGSLGPSDAPLSVRLVEDARHFAVAEARNEFLRKLRTYLWKKSCCRCTPCTSGLTAAPVDPARLGHCGLLCSTASNHLSCCDQGWENLVHLSLALILTGSHSHRLSRSLSLSLFLSFSLSLFLSFSLSFSLSLFLSFSLSLFLSFTHSLTHSLPTRLPRKQSRRTR